MAPAWAEWVNANGGINGHPVRIYSYDDKGSPVDAQAAGKQLITDGVQVVLVSSDTMMPAYDSELLAAKIPLVSGTTNTQDWYSKTDVFPTPTDNVSGLDGQVHVAKQFGHATKFANLYCSELAACGQADPPLKAAAAKYGVGYTSLAVSSTAVSYTAQCLQLQQAKVDYVQLNFASAAAAKLISDCNAQSYNPTWGAGDQVMGDPLLKTGATVYGPAYAFPESADSPVVKTFVDVMNRYAKDDNWHQGAASYAWQGLEMIRKALGTVSASTPVTASTVTTALRAIRDENLGGLLANKISYDTKQQAVGAHPCVFVIGIKNGKYTAPNGLNPICPANS